MILDFEPSNGNYIIRAPLSGKPARGSDGMAVDQVVKELRDEFGLDWWPRASTSREGVFSTKVSYAAAHFWDHATARAQADPELQWISREIGRSRAIDSGSHYKVPADKELSPYQKADLDYMLSRLDREGVLDADEPGLGKTPTAIAFSNELDAQKVLIVCPAQIRLQWLERWREWTTGPTTNLFPVMQRKGGAANLEELGGNGVLAISYELASAPDLHHALMAQQFDLLILDEAHYLKTASSARTKAIFGGKMERKIRGEKRTFSTAGLASRSRHVLALTGTPLPNRPLEAYTLAHNFDPASIDHASEYAFGQRFNPREVREVQVYDADLGYYVTKRYSDESSGRHAELQARMRANFMCRHLKRDVLTQLKLPRYDLVRADETAPVKAALRAERLLDIDPDTLTGAHADVLGHIAEARRMMGVALAPQAVAYAGMLLESGVEKLAIFYWHIEVGDILAAELQTYGVCRVDGRTTPVIKDAQKHRFRTDPRFRIIIGNVLSLGTGTDGLQDVCSYAFIAEPDWVPGNNIQCVDRLDRRGQLQTVNADILVAPGSIAERVLASALRKAKVTHNALDRRVA